jgi:MoaA/NifB/PqqE/SkfB family radical SAM enzyme
MKRTFFNIDVLGSCNLRCPSCPVGNTKDYKIATGFMEPASLEAIIKKAKSECTVTGVGLFNWTEPILHPQLPELIKIVQTADLSCYLSSNLNTLRNIDAVMAANPYSFRISASGFTQEVYGYTHRGGDIERVKKNMVALAEAKKRQKATTRVHVLYHRYKHNLKDEPLMREFAANLGIEFQPVWAFMMPLEKILAYANDDDQVLSQEDRNLIDHLALPLREALETSEKYKEKPCSLQEEQITMDFQGNVQLCCAVYDARKFTLGNYLEHSLEEIQKRKYAHSMCEGCMARGAHVYVTYGAHELEQVAAKNLAKEDLQLLDLTYELRQKKLRRGLEWVYRTFFSGFISPEQSAQLGDKYDRAQRGLRKFLNSEGKN